jgi:hypothetical protein
MDADAARERSLAGAERERPLAGAERERPLAGAERERERRARLDATRRGRDWIAA